MTGAIPIKLILKTPEFFETPLKKLIVEENVGADRVYFLNRKGRIVAVAARTERPHAA